MADHVEQPNPLACNVCPQSFPNIEDAKKHRSVHQAHKFACPECGYVFIYMGTYYEHYNVHIPHVKGRHSKKSTKKPKAPLLNKVADYQEIVKAAVPDYKNQFVVKASNLEVSQVLFTGVEINSHLLGLVKFKHTFAIPGFAQEAFMKDSIIDLLLYNKFPLVATPAELNSIRVHGLHANPEKQQVLNFQENATVQTVVGRTFDDLVLSNTQNILLKERWFLQLSYYVQPLLLRQSGQPALGFNISSTLLEKSPDIGLDSNLEIANGYYHSSVALVQLLRQIYVIFHKDFSLEQVEGNLAKADDAIMLDKDGYVSETNATNVFLVEKGCVLTPHADYCLPGITRATIPIYARAQDLARLLELKKIGATDALENTETSLQLGSK